VYQKINLSPFLVPSSWAKERHMPRTARVILTHMPHHIVQRGHNRSTVFRNRIDFRYYLKNLAELKSLLGLKVYSYCLMTNHIHLLIGTGDETGAVRELMKRLAARQTRLVNKIEGRTGSLWDGRYHISAVDSTNYMLSCMRYIELNPLKARMVSDPAHYEFSSYRARVGRTKVPWLDTDPCYRAMGTTSRERQNAYRDFILDHVQAEREREFLQAAVQRNQLTGSRAFTRTVETLTGHRVEFRGPGRPAVTCQPQPELPDTRSGAHP